ncbi:MAG: hypothetical protein R2780_02365 [Crocinitomicaceae bacterium]|nr:hypothetical protein [Crocinitomicaceae bacterium]
MEKIIYLLSMHLIFCPTVYSQKSKDLIEEWTMEIFEYNIEPNLNEDKERLFIIDNDTLVENASIIFVIYDQDKIKFFNGCIDSLILNNDFLNNYECFMPNIGIVVKKNEEIVSSYSVCLTCEKLYYFDYKNKKEGYLFFHNNHFFEKIISEYSLYKYRRNY